MQNQSTDKPVRVTGEQRLHPALRKLGRACIALARWQREQEQAKAMSSAPPRDKPDTPPARRAEADEQEARDG